LGGFAIGAPVALLWQHNANSTLLISDRRVTEAFSTLRAVYRKWAWLAGRWLAVDGGCSQHYCGSLDCGLPMVAFGRHNANAKCKRVHACTRSMPGYHHYHHYHQYSQGQGRNHWGVRGSGPPPPPKNWKDHLNFLTNSVITVT